MDWTAIADNHLEASAKLIGPDEISFGLGNMFKGALSQHPRAAISIEDVESRHAAKIESGVVDDEDEDECDDEKDDSFEKGAGEKERAVIT